MVTVKIFGERVERVICGPKNGEQVLRELGLNVNSSLILKRGKPIPEDLPLNEDDELTVIKSFSGG